MRGGSAPLDREHPLLPSSAAAPVRPRGSTRAALRDERARATRVRRTRPRAARRENAPAPILSMIRGLEPRAPLAAGTPVEVVARGAR